MKFMKKYDENIKQGSTYKDAFEKARRVLSKEKPEVKLDTDILRKYALSIGSKSYISVAQNYAVFLSIKYTYLFWIGTRSTK